MVILNELSRVFILMFVIALIGYAAGRVQICGISLGTAAIFIVGLFFGHFGVSLPASLQSVGLLLFIVSVGLSAGPSFFSQLKHNGTKYALLCLSTACAGGLVCIICIKVLQIDTPLALGMMTGAFTTSPGFAAAKEAVSGAGASLVATGYGIIYPVGVVTKVMLIQLIPRILRADMAYERALIAACLPTTQKSGSASRTLRIDPMGLFTFSLAVVLGLLVGGLTVPMPGGSPFSLGMTGGPLIVSLLIGHFGKIYKLDLRVDKSVLNPLKEFGLLLFFSCAGAEGGKSIVPIFMQHGPSLLIIGFFMVLIPFLLGFLLFRYILKLPLLNGMGSMSASMTCTPSLAMLIRVANTDDVAAAYATTYPIALIALVLLVQFLAAL